MYLSTTRTTGKAKVTYSNVSVWAYAFYLWLKRDLQSYQLYLDLYGSYEPERVSFEAMLAMAEG